MLSWLIKLFGVHGSGTIVAWQLVNRGGSGTTWLIILGIVLTILTFWLYQREEHLPPTRKYLLATLRSLFLIGLLCILLKPTLRFTIEGSVRRAIVVLIDGSGSMRIQDPRTEDDDLKRAGIALGTLDPTGGLKQALPAGAGANLSHAMRTDLIKGVLKSPQLALLKRLGVDYDIRPFTFSQKLADITVKDPAWIDNLPSDGTSTALGDAIRDVLSRTRGQPLAGIFLATDGASNAGGSMATAGEVAGQSGVPLYIWGVGLPSPRDIIVSSVYAEEVAFVDDSVAATVRVRSVGLKGQGADVILKQGDQEVARKHVDFGDDGEQVVQMEYTPKKAGDFKLTASVPPRADEVVKDNNEQSTQIRIIDGKIKVLFVEQTPRWEYKYLEAMLLRDRRIDLKVSLQEVDPQLASLPNSPYLEHFPADKKDLFVYDLVIFGDVDIRNFASGELASIAEYVTKFGGGLLMIAGRQHDPQEYRGTPLEKLLPVETDDQSRPADAGGDRPIQAELTAAGRASRMMRLADTEEASVDVWAHLPPIYWDAQIARAKPGAEVLAVDPDPNKVSRFGKMPLIAIQQFGLGQVMFVGTDNIWRWRRNVGDKFYTMFWGQVSQRLALPHLLGESKRTQITLDKKSYNTGDRVTVYARLYSEGYDPVVEPAVRGSYEQLNANGTPGPRQSIILRPLPEQPGMYRGEFTAPSEGNYDFSVERDTTVKVPFTVTEPKLELSETAMNEAGLQDMAKVSGGAFFREEDLYKMPDSVTSKAEKVRSSLDVELWSSPFYFLLLLAIVTAEWILRKLSQLK